MKLSKYTIKLESPWVEEFVNLRKRVGWRETDFEMAKTSLTNTLFHVVVRDHLKLIGMGRVIGDGSMYFYVQDIVVEPDYQKQGIGHILMQQIEIFLSKHTKSGATITLMAAKGKEGFYRRYGYVERPNDSTGNGMFKLI
ncbi:MAG: GNAT family N-acetyltransferase [Alteromonadaceae bacterium]|nr:GNAT family N-acetyltransferase [Alteromonadaceae bacterium]